MTGAAAGHIGSTPHGVSSRDKAQSLLANPQRSGRAGRFQIRLRTVSRPPAHDRELLGREGGAVLVRERGGGWREAGGLSSIGGPAGASLRAGGG